MTFSNIKKSSGNLEKFSLEKLRNSLIKAKTGDSLATEISHKLAQRLKEGQSTGRIYQLALKALQSQCPKAASLYGLNKSLLRLGPGGHYFEQFMGSLFQAKGYTVELNRIIPGKCVNHEVDFLYYDKDYKSYCECKFHNNLSSKNDIKVALYVYARSLDLKANPLNNFNDFTLITNTKFTKDALNYSECVGLKLLSITYPARKNIASMVEETQIYPITVLKCLNHLELSFLLRNKIISTQDFLNKPLSNISYISENKQLQIKQEIQLLCQN